MTKTKLKELINIETGSLNVQDSEKDGKYPFFSRKKEIYFLNEYTHDKEAVIVAGEGDFTPKYINGKFALHQRAYALSSTTELLSNKYLYYFIHTQKKILEKYSVGTTVQSLRKSSFEELEIALPPLHEQQKIASVLSALDDQIELNNKINQELEDLAQTLYNYWFVQFEFPNKEGKPYKSSGGKMVWNEELKREIPEGLEVKKLKDMIAEVKSGDWGKDEPKGNYEFETTCVRGADIPLILSGAIKALPKRYILKKNIEKLLSEHSFIVEISGGSNTQATGRVAYVNKEILSRSENKIICSNFCKAFTLKEADYFYFIFQTWMKLYSSGLMFNYEGKTTGIKNFLFDVFVDNIEIVIPDKTIGIRYNFFCEEVFDTIQKNKTQNQELTRLRDYLLPLLMNGQVTVSDELFQE